MRKHIRGNEVWLNKGRNNKIFAGDVQGEVQDELRGLKHLSGLGLGQVMCRCTESWPCVVLVCLDSVPGTSESLNLLSEPSVVPEIKRGSTKGVVGGDLISVRWERRAGHEVG